MGWIGKFLPFLRSRKEKQLEKLRQKREETLSRLKGYCSSPEAHVSVLYLSNAIVQGAKAYLTDNASILSQKDVIGKEFGISICSTMEEVNIVVASIKKKKQQGTDTSDKIEEKKVEKVYKNLAKEDRKLSKEMMEIAKKTIPGD